MHRAQLPFDKSLHLLGGNVWLGECALLIAVAAILCGSSPIRAGAAAQRVFAQRHSAALAERPSRSEHGYSDPDEEASDARVCAARTLSYYLARVPVVLRTNTESAVLTL